jgi:hypothetical protein
LGLPCDHKGNGGDPPERQESEKVSAHPAWDAFSRDASREKYSRANHKAIKTRGTASQPFMFHYAFSVASEPGLRLRLFQTVSNCFKMERSAGIVANRFKLFQWQFQVTP